MRKLLNTIAIFTAVIGIVGAQSFFNGILGADLSAGAAKSAAMGSTHMQNNNSSTLLHHNPAGLTWQNNWLTADYQFLGDAIRERRGYDLKDSFDGYLTTSDYVSNFSMHGLHQAGLVYNRQMDDINLAGAVAFIPLTTFDYNYEEEVRGSQSFDDGEFGIKDPIVGFHVMESEGTLYTLSIGGAIGKDIDKLGKFSVGFALNRILDSEIKHSIHADTIDYDEDYLSSVETYSNKADTNSDTYFTLGLNFPLLHGLFCAIAFESSAEIQTDGSASVLYNNVIGLPGYEYGTNSLYYVKPEKFRIGLKLIPRKKVPMVLSVEYESINSSDKLAEANLEDVTVWKFGFEYMTVHSVPLRAGLIFRESAFKPLYPESIFTFGTGKKFGNITVDISGQFTVLGTYGYVDLFPVDGDIRPEKDRVNESRFESRLTLTYGF
jgi:hypothetical protein